MGRLVDEMTIHAETTGYGLSFPLVDIERVEVLKGPQGTLDGEGSISGTVKYLTRSPTPGEIVYARRSRPDAPSPNRTFR